MQDEENLTLLPKRDLKRVEGFAKALGIPLSSFLSNPVFLSRNGRKDVFDLPLFPKLVVKKYLYSLGFYVGYIKDKVFYPSLMLSKRLSRLCFLGICNRVDDFGEKVFLYNRRVFEEHIVEFRKGISIVVNERGEPLGWGVGKAIYVKNKEIKVVDPLKDLGWYLRRGG
ncbi:MAG: hypothetical protein F7B11_04475 [Caldisphaeraceae archaeon]|nr:hypothetical protein [Caldisphaeraceae archaeon]